MEPNVLSEKQFKPHSTIYEVEFMTKYNVLLNNSKIVKQIQQRVRGNIEKMKTKAGSIKVKTNDGDGGGRRCKWFKKIIASHYQ